MQDHSAFVLNSVGIVPADLWLHCQDKLAHNRQVGNSGKGKHTWLSGLLKCAKCGYSLKVGFENNHRWLLCSGRYNLAHCDASIHVNLTELEQVAAQEIEKLLAECPAETVEPEKNDYADRLAEIDRRADRLLDVFAESDMSDTYLKRALSRLEKERQALLESRKREQNRPVLPDKLIFSQLSFEEKKTVAAQFIERIEVSEQSAEIKWKI